MSANGEEASAGARWTRRAVNWLLGTSLGALVVSVLYPVVEFLIPPEVPEASTNQVEAGPTNDPDLMGPGFKILRLGNCHNGWYDLNGQVVAGPPPRPLAPFKVDFAANGPGRPKTVVVSRE